MWPSWIQQASKAPKSFAEVNSVVPARHSRGASPFHGRRSPAGRVGGLTK